MIDGIEIFFMNFMDCRLKVFDLGGDEVMFSLYYFFLFENIFYQVVFDMSVYMVIKILCLVYQFGRVEFWF